MKCVRRMSSTLLNCSTLLNTVHIDYVNLKVAKAWVGNLWKAEVHSLGYERH